MPDSSSGADDDQSSAPDLHLPEDAPDTAGATADDDPVAPGAGSTTPAAAPISRSRRRVLRRRSRILLLVALGCALTLLVGLLWIAVTGLLARGKLQDAQRELPTLRTALLAGDLSRATTIATEIRSQTADAHSLLSGPAWWVAANLPTVGQPLQTARVVADTAHQVGQNVLPGVVQLATTVHDSSLHSGDTIDLAPLAAAQPVIARAQQGSSAALAELRGTRSTSWLSVVDRNRDAFTRQLTTLDGDLSGASLALRTALPMMGENGTRRYFLGFENEAEARGLGGLPGAFAIITVSHGKVAFTHFGNDNEFQDVRADVNLGADYNARYASADPAGSYVNSDIGPDFRDAARIWAGMWQKKSGQHVDGAIAVDPTALSYLLRVTGPAALPGGGQVSADNVVALTQQTQYSKFSDVTLRKKYVVGVSDAISQQITSGKGSTTGLLKALARGAKERRLVIWSSTPAEEADLITAGYAGVIESDGHPFTGFTVVNGGGNKLDYYLDRTATYTRTSCAAGTTATATLTLKNDAPRSGLPSYVTLRSDHPKYTTHLGDNFLILSYYGTPGARITSVTVDGKQVGVAVGSEHGLLALSLGVELPVQQTRTLTVTLVEPATTGAVRVLAQPGVRPVQVRVSSPCGS